MLSLSRSLRSSPMALKQEVVRTIHFYGTRLREPGGELADDQGAIWKALQLLPYDGDDSTKGRCVEADDGNEEIVDVLSMNKARVSGRIYRDKSKDFPVVGKKEKDRPLKLEDDDE